MFPIELFSKIFCNLELSDWDTISLVSDHFNQLFHLFEYQNQVTLSPRTLDANIKLTSVKYNYNICEEFFTFTKNSVALKDLHLDLSHISDDEFNLVTQIPQLKCLELEIYRGNTNRGLNYLGQAIELESLTLRCNQPGEKYDFKFLSMMNKLKRLQLIAFDNNRNEKFRLIGQPETKGVYLNNYDVILNDGLIHLKMLTNLKYLDLSTCNRLTDVGLEHIKDLIKLKILILTRCKRITDDGLIHLKKLIQLKILNVAGCGKITDDGLINLNGLTQLKSLNVISCKRITGRGFQYIQELKNLKKLTISNRSEIIDNRSKYLPHLNTLN